MALSAIAAPAGPPLPSLLRSASLFPPSLPPHSSDSPPLQARQISATAAAAAYDTPASDDPHSVLSGELPGRDHQSPPTNLTSACAVEFATKAPTLQTDLQPNCVSKGPLMGSTEAAGNDSPDGPVETGAGAVSSSEQALQVEGCLNGERCPQSENRDAGVLRRVPSHCGIDCGSPDDVYEIMLEESHNSARDIAARVADSPDKLQLAFRDSNGECGSSMSSSVRSWVDSLAPNVEHEDGCSLLCSGTCAIANLKHCSSLGRSPLHHHLGYKSPLDLIERIIFSEDEEMRARTESDSTASSSSSPNMPGKSSGAVGWWGHSRSTPGRSDGSSELQRSRTSCDGRDVHGPLLTIFKRRWQKGCDSPVNLKGKVVVNGHILSSAVVKQAEERAGKLRPGSYWYDCTAGFWGVEGGPCRGVLPPLITELSRQEMLGNCSNGDTKVYVNGRELASRDLAVLSERGLPQKPGKTYSLSIDGVLVDDTTGLEVKHLGKLAPTLASCRIRCNKCSVGLQSSAEREGVWHVCRRYTRCNAGPCCNARHLKEASSCVLYKILEPFLGNRTPNKALAVSNSEKILYVTNLIYIHVHLNSPFVAE